MRKAYHCVLLAFSLLFLCGHVDAADEACGSPKIFGGLNRNVEIVIDQHGFPHIYAENEADAMFALGYMHARDRLWQMDFNRRAAQGRLAEIMGPDAAYHDIFVRTIGINRFAKESAERVRKHDKLYHDLAAYAWGVNSCIAEKMPDNLPPEFRRLDYIPDPWTIEDSLAIGKAMSWELCGSLDDLYLATLVQKLGRQTVDELFPVDRYKEVPIIPSDKSEDKPAAKGEARAEIPARVSEAALRILGMASGEFRIIGGYGNVGSNSWVIDSEKSADGMPILASDPHLGFQMPSIWYVAHIKGGDLDVMGVSMPGIPIIAIGFNRNIAWGVTNTQADVTDFFAETLNKEKTRYLYKGEWRPLEFLTETVKVRGEEPRELKIPVTLHGPILSTPAAGLAIKWIGAEPDDDALAFYLLDHGVDYDDFAAAMRTLNSPPQNFSYADSNGMIAMWVAGLFPIRKNGRGRVPADGSSGEFDWTGFIPRMDTPHIVNPPQHYLASANQRPAPADYPYYLGYEWDPGYRARRINGLLSSHNSITSDMMKQFQADTYDTAASSMLPHLISACENEFGEGNLYAKALEILSAWDFFTTTDKAAPKIWWTWLDKFSDAVWQDEWQAAGIELPKEPWGHTDLNKWQPPLEVLERMVLEEPASKWFDDVTTEESETLSEIAVSSLREAVNELRSIYGEDISQWTWGRSNRLRINHLSGDTTIARGGQPLDGSDFTLNARGNGGEVTSGPSWRMVIDFGNPGRPAGIFPGGQSEDPQSPHYDDLLDKWVRNEYVRLIFPLAPDRFNEDQVENRLKLQASSDNANPLAP